MADIDHIIELLLGDRRIREGAAFSSRTFSDQPLIERGSDLQQRMRRREEERAKRHQQQAEIRAEQRAVKHAAPAAPKAHPLRSIARLSEPKPVPKRIREMRRLERGNPSRSTAYGSVISASLFLRQARLMEDYEDSYDFHGGFSQYYPTYATMDNHQLRGYFSWRTKVRAGDVREAPLSFAFVYVYELLCGVGTTPGIQGLHDLRAFGTAWRDIAAPNDRRLDAYLPHWERDYAVYHDIVDELLAAGQNDFSSSVAVLLRAEHAQLAAAGREPRITNPAAEGPAPSPEELCQALSITATYHLNDSRLTKAEPQLVAAVASDVFSALVDHCAKRRKTDFVEGLFGYATLTPYTMFPGAVFCEETPHEDCEVRVSELESYRCKGGRWQRLLCCPTDGRNKELGQVLHFIDYELRNQLSYAYPLKQRKPLPKYLERMVVKAVAARLKEREEAEKRRITIDRSKLGGIRAAAAVTQEALLTDEERGIEPVPASPAPAAELIAALTTPEPGTPEPQSVSLQVMSAADAPAGVGEQHVPSAMDHSPSPHASHPYGLTDLEVHLLAGLLAGTPAAQLLGPTDPFVSVVADSINEKLFDLVGDAVIDFDGDEPCLIEDYLDDIREVLTP